MPDDEIEVPADQPDPPYVDDSPPEPVRPDTGPLPVPEDGEGEVSGGVEP